MDGCMMSTLRPMTRIGYVHDAVEKRKKKEIIRIIRIIRKIRKKPSWVYASTVVA